MSAAKQAKTKSAGSKTPSSGTTKATKSTKTTSAKAAGGEKKAAARPAARGNEKKKTAGSAAKNRKTSKAAKSSSRVLIVCMIILLWALSLITLMRLGAAGKFLYGLLSLIGGSCIWVLLPACMILSFMYIWEGGRHEVSGRFWTGMLFLAIAWCMMAALPALKSDEPFRQLVWVQQHLMEIFSGQTITYCGLLGAACAGFFTLLFSVPGAWIFAIAFLIAGAALSGWDLWRQRMIEWRAKAPKAQLFSLPETPEPKYSFELAAAAEPSPKSEPGGFFASFFGREARKEPSGINFIHLGKDAARDEQSKSSPAAAVRSTDVKKEVKEESKRTAAYHQPLFSFEKKAAQSQDEPDCLLWHTGQQPAVSGSLLEQDFLSDFRPEAGLKDSANEPAAILSGKAPAVSDPAASLKNNRAAKAKPEADDGLSLGLSKNVPEVSRSRPKPAEPSEEVRQIKSLPAASSCDLSRYTMPKINLLNDPGRIAPNNANVRQAKEDGSKLISILGEFGVKAELNDIHIGPSVTKFEIAPGQGVRVNSITNLQNDIKMALAATDIRIEAPIPGKSAVGIEVPNVEKTEVSMKELLKNIPPRLAGHSLVFCLGKDLLGDNVYGRLDTMPHLLIAGATGSGKSVCVNSIISSILMRTRPDEVKLILVDPKKVEFTPYNGVPHLLAPVITDGDLASKALQVVVTMMDHRYDLFEEAMVRNITAYNKYVDEHPDSHLQKLPRIVVIIDELADLMLAAAKEVEQSIQRITQLARAAGIHLIVATQRPSVNVITGVIKANIPSRIAFAVSSSVDSRTILDQAGAERLLGYGDMLFLDNGETACRRIQGVFIKDEEVMRIAEYVKSQAAPAYDDAFLTLKDLANQGGPVAAADLDPLYEEVKHFVIQSRKASTSLIQRRFSLGYARAARLVDSLEANKIVGPANGSKPREILVGAPADEFDELL